MCYLEEDIPEDVYRQFVRLTDQQLLFLMSRRLQYLNSYIQDQVEEIADLRSELQEYNPHN